MHFVKDYLHCKQMLGKIALKGDMHCPRSNIEYMESAEDIIIEEGKGDFSLMFEGLKRVNLGKEASLSKFFDRSKMTNRNNSE